MRNLAPFAALALLAAAPSFAQDKPVEMRFAHWVPANHPLARLGYDVWAKSIEAASKNTIKVTVYPAQQLGKAPDHYDMARDGIADLTWVNPGYQAGRFPMFAAGELPFLVTKPGPALTPGTATTSARRCPTSSSASRTCTSAHCTARRRSPRPTRSRA
jgi:TRAP-type C4-dicarboxylate transport system substrate-binding protein